VAEEQDQHVDHDPMLIAALLDADLDDAERAAGEAQVVACVECADLRADLLALSSATRALPTPPRPRDFRLTATDAARIAGTSVGEPGAPAARLTGVMNGTRDHASHDSLLVAALADRTLGGPERAAAEGLVAACSLCARLHADLVAISTATRQLPAPARTRDFMLTLADAERLRPSGWRRLIAAFGTSRDTFSRPLAAGLTAIGLAGLLFATIPGTFGQQTTILSTVGSAVGQGAAQGLTAASSGAPSGAAGAVAVPAATAASGTADSAARSSGSVAAPAVPLVPAGASVSPAKQVAPAASGGFGSIAQPSEDVYSGSGEGPGVAAEATGPTPSAADDLAASPVPPTDKASAGPSTMVVLSGVLLLIGLALFAVRWTAHRAGRD
jgi:hypothetical protein